MSPTGQYQALVSPVQPRTQPGDVVDEDVVDQLDGARGCAHRGIEATALGLAEPQPVGVGADVVEGQAAGTGSQPFAPRSQTDIQVEDTFGPLAFSAPTTWLGSRPLSGVPGCMHMVATRPPV